MGQYKYSFRFNATHSNFVDLKGLHAHTFTVTLYLEHDTNQPFHVAEKDLKEYINQYKGKCLNDMFDTIPLIETIAYKFYQDLDKLVGDNHISCIEISDSPTQVYCLHHRK